jgi:hypothetical protein
VKIESRALEECHGEASCVYCTACGCVFVVHTNISSWWEPIEGDLAMDSELSKFTVVRTVEDFYTLVEGGVQFNAQENVSERQS